ncbi:MAG TPA: DUF87 domain-containing protein [Candidatus Dormibacteraeota bacterium]
MGLTHRAAIAALQELLLRGAHPDDAGVQVAAGSLVRADGIAVIGLRCGPLDVTSMDPERRGALEAAFSHLCRTLEAPLQLLLRVRRWEPEADVANAPGGAAPLPMQLAAAEGRHERDLLTERPAFRRDLLVLTTAPARQASSASGANPVEAALRAAGVEVEPLDGRALAVLLAEAWGDDDPPPQVVGRSLGPPGWSATATSVRCGGILQRGLWLRHLPGVAVEAGWLAPILRVRAECDVTLHMAPVRLDEAMARLSRRLRALRADQLAEMERESAGDATVEAGVDAALDLRDRLARNEGRSLTLSVTAVARGRDPTSLDAAARALRAGFAMALTRAPLAHLEHRAAGLCTLPLVDDRSPHRKLVDSASAASCVPFVEAICDDAGGYLLGRAVGSDTPVRLALFDRTRYPNANVAVLAASGRGKSYAIGMLVLAAAARGIGSLIIDPEGEYERLVAALGGRYLHLRPGCGTALNVFDVATAGDADDGDAAVGAVLALVDTLVGGTLDEGERAHLDAAARAATAAAVTAGRVAVLGDCLDHLDDRAPRIAPVLRRFCHGPLGDLFNRPTSLRATDGVVGLGLRDLREELVAPATLIVAEWLWGLVRRDPRDRHIVFDEVGLLVAYPALRTLLAQLARRCRKYSASLVVATQNAGDLLAGEEGRVIATNPATILLGGHRGAETSRMQDAYSLTDPQRAWLEGAARGEFLLLAGARRLPVHVSAPPLHHALLTGGAHADLVCVGQ